MNGVRRELGDFWYMCQREAGRLLFGDQMSTGVSVGEISALMDWHHIEPSRVPHEQNSSLSIVIKSVSLFPVIFYFQFKLLIHWISQMCVWVKNVLQTPHMFLGRAFRR